MGLPLQPTVPPSPVLSKIVYPSQPPQVPPPVLSYVAGGSLAVPEYFVKITFVIQTQDGVLHESLPSNESVLAVPANNLLSVASPSAILMPYALVGWNVYVSAASGDEELQNSTPIAIGTNWQEPVSGLVAGVPPPTTWGNTLVFTFPGRNFPYSNRDAKLHDEFSTAGWYQGIVWYVDNLWDFSMPYVKDGNDVAGWDQFLAYAVQRGAWDFYLDSTQSTYLTLIMTTMNPKLAYKAPGLWSVDVRARQVILQQ
jgi:hypothetical protein